MEKENLEEYFIYQTLYFKKEYFARMSTFHNQYEPLKLTKLLETILLKFKYQSLFHLQIFGDQQFTVDFIFVGFKN